MDFLKFIVEEAWIMVPVLYIVAEIIKRTKRIANEWIPFIIVAISLGFTPWLLGGYTPAHFVQSILVAGVEMLGFQLIDKGRELTSKDDTKEYHR